MENKKEMRVYVAPFDCFGTILNDELTDVNNIDDETFMQIVENEGEVYSLQHFQDVWNNDSSMCPMADYTYIRFIEVENYN